MLKKILTHGLKILNVRADNRAKVPDCHLGQLFQVVG